MHGHSELVAGIAEDRSAEALEASELQEASRNAVGAQGSEVSTNAEDLDPRVLHAGAILRVEARRLVLPREVSLDERRPHPELGDEDQVVVQFGYGAGPTCDQESQVIHGPQRRVVRPPRCGVGGGREQSAVERLTEAEEPDGVVLLLSEQRHEHGTASEHHPRRR